MLRFSNLEIEYNIAESNVSGKKRIFPSIKQWWVNTGIKNLIG